MSQAAEVTWPSHVERLSIYEVIVSQPVGVANPTFLPMTAVLLMKARGTYYPGVHICIRLWLGGPVDHSLMGDGA